MQSYLDTQGMLAGATQIASPNFDERPEGALVTLMVIHGISLPPEEFGGEAIQQLFTNTLDCTAHPFYRELRGIRVSAHFLIRRDGEIVQFVPCNKRAWHAGLSHWAGYDNCNDFSIGVELEGADTIAYTDIQYRQLAELTDSLLPSYPIRDIVGHSDVAPVRKTDPGPAFEWSHLRLLLARKTEI